MDIKQIDIEKMALAIEADAGEKLPGLRESLEQAKRGEFAAVHTPAQIMARRGRPVGSTKPDSKAAVKMRLDPDLLAVLRAFGRGWQTRANQILREQVLSST
jgi:uncharacterized protein (DUF4415 family)